MYIRKLIAIAAVSLISSISTAQDAPQVETITKGIIAAASAYQNAISCSESRIQAKDIAALIPWKTFDDRMDAKYAVLLTGDIGCAGGSGTNYTYIAMISIGSGNSFVVDPSHSSPVIAFESPARYVARLVGNTRDTLILEGYEFGPNDANCCPSINLRFTLRVDAKGNWKLVEKKVIAAKK